MKEVRDEEGDGNEAGGVNDAGGGDEDVLRSAIISSCV